MRGPRRSGHGTGAPLPAARHSGARPAARGPGRDSVEGAVELPVDPRHRPEERLVEERHGGPDLVHRTRRQPADRRRSPQDADLLAQPAPYLRILHGTQARIVHLLQEPIAASQRRQHRAAPGLRRVRGEDRRDPHPPEQLHDALARPAALRQPVDRRVRASLGGTSSRSPVGPEAPDALPLFRQVDELEVEAEGGGQRLGLADFERVELGGKRALGRLVARLPESDGAQPGPLDEVEQVRAALLGDDLAQQGAEQLDLARERVPSSGGIGGISNGGLATGMSDGHEAEDSGLPRRVPRVAFRLTAIGCTEWYERGTQVLAWRPTPKGEVPPRKRRATPCRRPDEPPSSLLAGDGLSRTASSWSRALSQRHPSPRSPCPRFRRGPPLLVPEPRDDPPSVRRRRLGDPGRSSPLFLHGVEAAARRNEALRSSALTATPTASAGTITAASGPRTSTAVHRRPLRPGATVRDLVDESTGPSSPAGSGLAILTLCLVAGCSTPGPPFVAPPGRPRPAHGSGRLVGVGKVRAIRPPFARQSPMPPASRDR